MPITPEQVTEVASILARAYNVADHLEDMVMAEYRTPDPLRLAAFRLKYEQYEPETLRLLIQAFPAYLFLETLTPEELKPLADAMKEAYEKDKEDAETKRETKNYEDSPTPPPAW